MLDVLTLPGSFDHGTQWHRCTGGHLSNSKARENSILAGQDQTVEPQVRATYLLTRLSHEELHPLRVVVGVQGRPVRAIRKSLNAEIQFSSICIFFVVNFDSQ